VPYRRLSEAKALFEAEDFEGATRLLRAAAEAARDGVTRLVEEAIAAAESNLEHSRKLGADTKRAEELVARARDDLMGGSFEQALVSAKESQEAVQVRLDTEKKFAERSFQAESTIRKAKKFGIDVLEAERQLAEAIGTKKTDFDASMSLAEKAFQTAEKAIESFAPNLTASFEVQSPVAGEWAEATLTIANGAKALAKEVRVKILGDVEVEGLRDIPSIKAKGAEALPIRVKMIAGGSVPLAIQIKSQRILDGKEYASEVIATVEVARSRRVEAPATPSTGQARPAEPAPAQPGPEAPQLKANMESRCPMCRGSIKVGFTIRRCSHCGSDMHELCFSRATQCPACKKPLGAKKKIAFKVG